MRVQSAQVRILFCLAAVLATIYLAPAGSTQQQKVTQPTLATTNSQASMPNQNTGNDEDTIVNTDLISFNVTVTDRYGRFVSGLNRSAFAVYDENRQQEITFFSDADAPISIGIIFDISGSMSGAKIERARVALAHFIQTSHPQDEYSLIGFNSRAEMLVERTNDADAVLRKLTLVQPRGDTALYDAVYLAAEKLQHSTHPKRVLLLITDGGENDSRYSFKEVSRSLEESGVMLYSICVLDRINLAGKAGGRVQDTLNGLSEITGGQAFYPQSTAEMDEVFEHIALELRHQYSIGYRPENFTANGRWHSLQVKVTPPVGYTRLSVQSRKGYYALSGKQ